jgi:hypothetical protein
MKARLLVLGSVLLFSSLWFPGVWAAHGLTSSGLAVLTPALLGSSLAALVVILCALGGALGLLEISSRNGSRVGSR